MEKNSADRVKKYRERMKKEGFKNIYVALTPEHRDVLNGFCKAMKSTQSSVIAYLLDCAEDGLLPEVDKPRNDA